MKEQDVRRLVESLFLHVAAMPWRDAVYMRSEAMKQAAKDQIIEHTVREIMNLNKEESEEE